MISSSIGSQKLELDTPLLCLDGPAMERNIDAMADFIAARGKQWRPHMKCHKSPTIALKQMAAGAIGQTCGKVSEAEVMAAVGIRDLLIANMIVGRPKLERVVALCGSGADPIVACDHYVQVEPLAELCRQSGVACRVVIEVNVGMDRVGIRPGRDTFDLAEAIDRLTGVEMVGLMGYEGHLHQVAEPNEKRAKINEAMGVLEYCRDGLLKKGICCDIISAAGTGSYQFTADHPAVTELQCGGGIFGDPKYTDQYGVKGLEPALTVLTTVVSRTKLERAIVDAGRKAVNGDMCMPLVKGFPDAKVVQLSAEHGWIDLGPGSQDLKIGDKIELIVGYADFTSVLHDAFHVFRCDRLEAVWPIVARGALQ
jgi:D-serine deaminase-like pyridoxal phosphate-dependent protein